VNPPTAAAAEPTGDRLGVLAAGLTQVGVQVDEAGQQHEAVGVDLVPHSAVAGAPGLAGCRGDGADLVR
jgi:hypothetical protein